MTRRLLILSLCIVLTLAAQAKKETQDFVTQFMTELENDSHVSEDDYRCVTVSPQMMAQSLRVIQKIRPKWLACGHGLPVRYRDAEPVIAAYLSGHADPQTK